MSIHNILNQKGYLGVNILFPPNINLLKKIQVKKKRFSREWKEGLEKVMTVEGEIGKSVVTSYQFLNAIVTIYCMPI